ncbi:hypothetical protein UFOVP1357_12 [uncultured Caudovirales phage]|uniref:Uncharacterized protein n=1 Tax=uncultured Caudovirales phage TaxID=2100421 RepID=A0A6J5MHR9_9CAUD|nr:hypothetical protein UFOVP18_2 [uncultured Caudovirales phage]CAB4126581.1 hypothetical protein UFOVP82_4 [uncultured Caudovirales phage]CAB4132697.1 hypothetical protein UFOVP258_53 [uncultured Caudovirales phage]CAB4146595.1 hypothetical protein UFOVP502_45 [uncultured Caudovirales phage]CAB4199759.1 hypothetical protein UFOVP1357_12 [uncultured Caudovirales phage]
MKKVKQTTFHTPKTRIATGDDHGIGVKQPVGTMRSKLQDTWVPEKKMKVPPKKLA